MSFWPTTDPACTSCLATPAIATIIDGRARDLGGFSVRRLLPSATRRLVGPFIFSDHTGPVQFEPGAGIDVRPHPHIGLATVTYLFEGEIVHRDSLGSHQPIRAGEINWMTAGRGIAHSERTGPELRRAGSRLHGLQLWVALPSASEETEPEFRHHPANASSFSPGSSALFVLVRRATADKVLEGLKPFTGKGKVFQSSLSKDDEIALRKALETP